jgi:hypothetical protein
MRLDVERRRDHHQTQPWDVGQAARKALDCAIAPIGHVRLRKRERHATIGSMFTTIIAIYGAVVATVSTLLGLWYFARSGPKLQAEATVDPVAIGEDINRPWDDIEYILLRVWNTGRAEITVQINHLMFNHGRKHLGFPRQGSEFIGDKGKLRIGIDGPEVPIRIPGHSGEYWLIEGGFDTRSAAPYTPATLSIALEVGGRRIVDVPVLDGFHIGMIKRPYILESAPELEHQPEAPATRIVRQQPVRKATRKRPRKR